MEMRLLDLESPITTHQPSSRFCRRRKELTGWEQWGTVPFHFCRPSVTRFSTYLGEKGSDDRPGDLFFTLQLHQHHHGPPTGRENRH